MPPLSTVLFVEGSSYPSIRQERTALERIWNDHLINVAGIPAFSEVYPISKKHLIAMDPAAPQMSGAAERLDQLMARKLVAHPFEVAVVAWDLVPDWNSSGEYCRWLETIRLYEGLSESEVLPDLWRNSARRRLEELRSRPTPSARRQLPLYRPGMVYAVCMDPMFEALLTESDLVARRALGVAVPPAGWPRGGWGDRSERRPDAKILAPAVAALGNQRPRPRIVNQVRGNMRTNKEGWGEFILRRLREDPEGQRLLQGHRFAKRLRELMRRGMP
jgi:hypothetical protein